MSTEKTLMTVKEIGSDEKGWDVEFVCSTDVVDRSDEVIEQDGWQLDRFKQNPVFLAAHLHKLSSGSSPVIGKFTSIGVVDNTLTGRVKFAPTALGEEYKQLYMGKFMHAVSVGFMSLQKEWKTTKSARRIHHVKAELYETSAVAVGCNHEALSRLEKAMNAGQTGEEKSEDNKLDVILNTLVHVLECVKEQNLHSRNIVDSIEELTSVLPEIGFSNAAPHESTGGGEHERLENPDTDGSGSKGVREEGVKQLLNACT